MKEKPILFSAPMVRALLEGRKTQTRRVMKPQPVEERGADERPVWVWKCNDADCPRWSASEGVRWERFGCPYGQPGGRLWVRETWRVAAWRVNGGKLALDYRASPEVVRTPWLFPPPDKFQDLWKQSSLDCERAQADQDSEGEWSWEPGQSPCRWRSSIHMPRWASRLTLEVVEVRVERLNDISEEDAVAEGLLTDCDEVGVLYGGGDLYRADPRRAYRDLWESINGAGSWAANPWVWCIGFKRVEEQKARGAA